MAPKNSLRIDEKPKYWQAFLLPLCMTIVVFLPFVIIDSGYFLFYGDFNVQQIPFYQMCHDAVRAVSYTHLDVYKRQAFTSLS